MLKNPLFCDFLEKPSLDFAETYLFLILEVCSLKRNHFHLLSNFLGSQPILAQCERGVFSLQSNLCFFIENNVDNKGLKRNHFYLVSYFLGSQPILAQCAVKFEPFMLES